MNVAIIGSGISGLTTAHYLRDEHEVTLFESNNYAGGHTHTVDILIDGCLYAIDTGFIVFNDRTYPKFVALLSSLGIKSQPTEMSFSVTDERNGLEYNGGSLNGLFAQRANLLRPGFYRMLRDVLRFNRQARSLTEPDDANVTVQEFLNRNRYSTPFAEQYLLPMGAAIWSCPIGKFAEFPIHFVVEFYRNHGLLNLVDRPIWRVVKGGSRSYVERILAGLEQRLRLKTSVERVKRFDDCVAVYPEGAPAEIFDHVVFACHADQALSILGDDAMANERSILRAFPYEKNLAVLHTDTSVLPQNRRAWASWNYRIRRGSLNDAPVDVTYNMNILQQLKAPRTFCVTLNPRAAIDPAMVLGEYIYHHPVFTLNRAQAQSRRDEFCFANRTSFCGAYWRNGFHEDGVVSALEVVDAIRHFERNTRNSCLESKNRVSSTISGSGEVQC